MGLSVSASPRTGNTGICRHQRAITVQDFRTSPAHYAVIWEEGKTVDLSGIGRLPDPVDTIATVLYAHDRRTVIRGIREWRRRLKHASAGSGGWRLLRNGEHVPERWDRMEVGGKVFVRPPRKYRVGVTGIKNTRKARTDLSVRPAPAELKCPRCGDRLFIEPICPGCREGRQGYRIRLLCGECDYEALL